MNSMILLCAGAGSRVGLSLNKLLLKHENKTLAQYTLENIFSSNQIDELIIVVKNSEIEIFKNILSKIRHTVKVKFTSGGKTRFESVKNGLLSVDPESDYLLIHDCARPFINNKIIKILLNNIDKDTPGAIPFLSCSDTIKEKEKIL
ncbi:2-C-methyl-D-erythritol 4-phosphate cytidylyltransferase [Dialister micraerophilus DSM 19965]|uniref:2-C-methyl-D-erythritol 4-phosphate cytidylyltransferase n=1 Tax=Dialister micraerophilus DSM 19965 TaxID=888062 RepID=F2BV78_9FIRM|nr:2-C-methyl-D-erythritol 4-phosphate cytidylyltransferase [Dialister micraerophilus DSM 19965]